MARTTIVDVPQRKTAHPKKALVTNADNQGDDGEDSEMEQGTSTPEEVTWDGLVRPDGSPVAVYIWADILRDTRKMLQRQIEDLGGEEAMIQDEADIIIVPPRKFTTSLAITTKRKGKLLRRTDWLTRLAEARGGAQTMDVYPQTPKRAARSAKPWNSADYRNLADYIARVSPGDTDGGRQGSKIYQALLDSTHLTLYRWAEGYTTEQLRLRYKKYKNQFDEEIRRIVREHPEYLTSHIRRVAPRQEDNIFTSQQQLGSAPQKSTALRTPLRLLQSSKESQPEGGQGRVEGGQPQSPTAFQDVDVVRTGEIRQAPHAPPVAEISSEPIHRDRQEFDVSQRNASVPQPELNASPMRARRDNAPSRAAKREGSAGTHKFPASATRPTMPPPLSQLSGTTLAPSQRKTRPTENNPSTPPAPAPPDASPQERYKSVDYSPSGNGVPHPVRPAGITTPQRFRGIPSNYTFEPRKSDQSSLSTTDPIKADTGLLTSFSHIQTGQPSRTAMMTRHASAHADTAGPSARPNTEFLSRRAMLHAVGAVTTPSGSRKSRPSSSSARRESSFVTPQTASIALLTTRHRSRFSTVSSTGTTRRGHRHSRTIPVIPRRSVAGGDTNPKNPILASVNVPDEQASFLKRRGAEYGFRYEEVLEQYLLTKGDLRETVQRLRNLQEAAQLILEDQAEAMVEVGGGSVDGDMDLKQEKLDPANNTHDPHTSGSMNSRVSDSVVQAAVDEVEEVLHSDLPPPNSAAKAFQSDIRRRSLRHP